MAISFPTNIDTFANPDANDKRSSPSHASQHADVNDAVEALEAKVGKDGSAVTTSHDYKLSGVTGTDKAASLTGTETFTNKTLTSPRINENVAVTATATELNKLDGVTATTAELNITDGGSADGKVLNVQSKCYAYLSADQEDVATATATKILLDSELYDAGGNFADYKFTAPISGYYLVVGQVGFVNAGVTADKSYHGMLYVNGAQYGKCKGGSHSSHIAFMVDSVPAVVYMDAESYLELYVIHYAGVNRNIESDMTYLCVHLLSSTGS